MAINWTDILEKILLPVGGYFVRVAHTQQFFQKWDCKHKYFRPPAPANHSRTAKVRLRVFTLKVQGLVLMNPPATCSYSAALSSRPPRRLRTLFFYRATFDSPFNWGFPM